MIRHCSANCLVTAPVAGAGLLVALVFAAAVKVRTKRPNDSNRRSSGVRGATPAAAARRHLRRQTSSTMPLASFSSKDAVERFSADEQR